MAKMSTLSDDFTTYNSSKWYLGSATVSGNVSIVPTSSYPSFVSTTAYDLTNSYGSVKVIAPNVGTGTIEADLKLQDNVSGNNGLAISWINNTLIFRETIAGSSSDTSITYNATAHAFWRIRESAGIIYWDTSPDGQSWTNQRSKASTANGFVTSLLPVLQTGYYGTEPSPGTAIWDNFNLPTPNPKTATLIDYFTAEDNVKWGNYPDLNVAATSGTLQIIPTTGYPGIYTNTNYDLTSSSVYVQLASPPNVGSGTISAELIAQVDANNKASIIWQSGSIVFNEIISNVYSSTSVTYDAVAHKYLRLREATGTIYWDTSPDGITWTNRRSKASPLILSNIQILLISGFTGTEPSPGLTKFDNLNCLPKVSDFSTNFSSYDSVNYALLNSATISGGQLSLPPSSSYGNIFSVKSAVDLTGSSVSAKFIQTPNIGNGTTQVQLYFQDAFGTSNAILMNWNNGQLYFTENVNAVADNVVIPFNPIAHLYWRIRENAGTIYWDTSPDGAMWVNRRSKVTSISGKIQALNMIIQAGYYGTEPSPGAAIFDDFNILPTPTPGTWLPSGMTKM